jgi:hypothetical protein
MSLTHVIIAGLVPKDGNDVQKALNEASAEGYVLISTTSCAIDEENAYYIATLGKPVVEPAKQRGGIGMSGGGSNRISQNVDARPPAQSENPG